jgi:phosphoribosylanthranilate isomerase
MQVKICGLSTPESVNATVAAGADYVGFVFFPKSPRHVTLSQATALAKGVPDNVVKVALTVNADDAFLADLLAAVPVDVLQLHGSEAVERVAEVKARFGLPVMKAVGVADVSDLPALDAYSAVVDLLLVDAKPPKGSALPGGNAVAFDWRLIADRKWTVPWMLAGGLTPDNVAEAVRLTGAKMVDVSSGVESAPGTKDLNKIAAFIRAAKGAV